MTDTSPPVEKKRRRDEPLQVWLCIFCMRYSEYPGECTLCGKVILSKPVRVEIAMLQKISDLTSALQKLLDKQR